MKNLLYLKLAILTAAAIARRHGQMRRTILTTRDVFAFRLCSSPRISIKFRCFFIRPKPSPSSLCSQKLISALSTPSIVRSLILGNPTFRIRLGWFVGVVLPFLLQLCEICLALLCSLTKDCLLVFLFWLLSI